MIDDDGVLERGAPANICSERQKAAGVYKVRDLVLNQVGCDWGRRDRY